MTTKNYLFLFWIYFISCFLSASAKADHEHYHISDSMKNNALEKLHQTQEELRLKSSMTDHACQKVIERSHRQNAAYAFILYAPNSTNIHKIHGVFNGVPKVFAADSRYLGFRIRPTEYKNLNQSAYLKYIPVQSSHKDTWETILTHSTLIFPKQSTREILLSQAKPGPIPVPVPVPFYTFKTSEKPEQQQISYQNLF